MTTLADIFPDVQTLLSVAPEDLAADLLQVLQSEQENLEIGSVMLPLNNKLVSPDNPSLSRPRVTAAYRAVAEAWAWLEREGLIMHDLESDHFGHFILTRRGRKIKDARDLAVYRAGHLLPQGLLTEPLEEKVRPMFLRGDYDVAVFQAFKEVEVAVRTAIRASDDLIGVALMREAFHKVTGPLSDPRTTLGEREALMHLFSGAIGYAKNPGSHRNVTVARDSAARLIGFASELLQIVQTQDTLRSTGWTL